MGRWEKTHDALRWAALELFSERGYDATGTAMIAERAGVSEMTLFRHYPTKGSLLLADPFDPALAEAVRERTPGEPALTALAEGIRAAWQSPPEEAAAVLRGILRIAAATPTLRGGLERASAESEADLVDALADLGHDAPSARVAAAAAIAALSRALIDWATDDAGTDALDARIRAALDVLAPRG